MEAAERREAMRRAAAEPMGSYDWALQHDMDVMLEDERAAREEERAMQAFMSPDGYDAGFYGDGADLW